MKIKSIDDYPEKEREEIKRLLCHKRRVERYYEVRNKVKVEPMTEDVKSRLQDVVSLKACYNNAFNAFTKIFDMEVQYVAGYAYNSLGIPIDHAWVILDGVHYDPTWQIFSELGQIYDARFVLSRHELIEAIEKNHNTPPSCWDMERITQKEQDK